MVPWTGKRLVSRSPLFTLASGILNRAASPSRLLHGRHDFRKPEIGIHQFRRSHSTQHEKAERLDAAMFGQVTKIKLITLVGFIIEMTLSQRG